MSYLVVGVGGTGRGCLAWLKELLEREFPSMVNKFDYLLVDGPEQDDAYELPLGTRFDKQTSKGRTYPLTKSPAEVIEGIRRAGDEAECRSVHEYIGSWLRPEQARRINSQNINPSLGFGQSRLPGRANFFLETPTLLSRLKGLAAGRTHAFLVGSLVGGTGAGQLLDLAALLRGSLAQGTALVLLVGVAGGYNAVFYNLEDQISQDARCFSAMRELYRLAGDPKWKSAYKIDYCKHVTMQDRSLFDLCYLLDGHGAVTPEKQAVTPALGVCNQAALTIMETCLSQSFQAGDFTQWIQRPLHHPRRLSTVGTHAYIYSSQQVLEAFKYRFAEQFYEKLLSYPEQDRTQDRLRSILQSGPFTNLILMHGKNQRMPWAPPAKLEDLLELSNHFSAGAEGRFDVPMANLDEEISIPSGLLGNFRGLSNADLVRQCRAKVEQVLGAPERATVSNETVYDFTGLECRRITRAFVEATHHRLISIFYDTETSPPKPYSLRARPSCLREAIGFVEALKEALQAFSAALTRHHDRQRDEEKVVHKALEELDRDAADLQGQSRRNVTGQERHRDIAQHYFNVRAWDVILEGMRKTVESMIRAVDDLWLFFGDPTESWKSFLEGMQKHVRTLKLHHTNRRRKMRDDLPFLRYLPRPETVSEQEMYGEQVTARNLLPALLDGCHWTFSTTRDQDGSGAPTCNLTLIVPPESFNDREATTVETVDIFTSTTQRERLVSHSWHDPARFLEAHIASELKALTIWDAFHYDWAEWRKKYSDNEPTFEKFVTSKYQKSITRSEPGLALKGHHGGEPTLHLFTSFTQASPRKTTDTATISRLFKQLVEGQAGAKYQDDPMFSKVFAVAQYTRGLVPQDWLSHESVLKNYLRIIDDTDREPMHAQVEEQNARHFEKLLQERRVADEEFLLDPSVVRFLGSVDQFTLWTLAWVFDLFEYRTDPARPENPRTVCIEPAPGGPVTSLSLGHECMLAQVLETFLDGRNEAHRSEIERCWQKQQATLLGPAMDRQALAQALYEKCPTPDAIHLPPQRPDERWHDPVDRKHLALAMWTAVEMKRKQLLYEQAQVSVR